MNRTTVTTPDGNGPFQIAYDLLGPDVLTATPIVLVHGFPLDRRVWLPVARQLAGRYTVILPDLPGFGESVANTDFTMTDLGHAIAGLAETLGLGRFVLAGLSMGGYVALSLAQHHRKKLAGLALVDTRSGSDNEQGRAGRDAMIELVRAQGTPAIVEKMFPNMTAPANQIGPVADELKKIMHACPPLTIARACAAMRDRDDFTPLLASIDCPSAVIVGAHDAITPPAGAKELAGLLPNAELTEISSAGHMSPLESPKDVAAAIEALMARI